MDIPAEIQEFVKQLCCRCGTPSGRGFVVNPTSEDHGVYMLLTKCLRCGYTGFVRVVLDRREHALHASVEPGPMGSDITSDEAIDLHEALKSDDWLTQLTKAKS